MFLCAVVFEAGSRAEPIEQGRNFPVHVIAKAEIRRGDKGCIADIVALVPRSVVLFGY